jgi:hypothetical protein
VIKCDVVGECEHYEYLNMQERGDADERIGSYLYHTDVVFLVVKLNLLRYRCRDSDTIYAYPTHLVLLTYM